MNGMNAMSFFKKGSNDKSEQNVQKNIFPTLEENIEYIRSVFCQTDDLAITETKWGEEKGVIIYLDTMVNSDQFQRIFLSPVADKDLAKQIEHLIASPDITKTNQLEKIVSEILIGSCVIFLQNKPVCYVYNIVQSIPRSPEEPDSEKAVRGSHKGFIENLEVNLNFIRERIKSPQLKIEHLTLQTETNVNVAIAYIEDIANPTTVENVRNRLNSIKSDMILSPGYIEESIEDTPFSPFPQVLYTERPDRVEANLIEGRIAIMSESSSDAIIAPVSFFSFFQSTDDYNLRFWSGSFFRLLRLFCFWGTLTLPALYIAVISFHLEIIPYDLIGLVKMSIEQVPFSPFFEAVIMITTIELIREAGIRLPTPIGQTIGIVGGLIIGDAVVNAGLVSNVMVIVVALTAIMSFCIPNYEMGNTLRLLGFPVMLGAASLGFVGMVFAFMFIFIHLCTLESFGVPYLSPIVPTHFREWKDAIIRAPNWSRGYRQKDLHTLKPIRASRGRAWDQHDK